MPKHVKEIDLEQIDHIYETVLQMTVPLDPDPLAHGPETLNQKTAMAQNMLSRLERILTQIAHDHHMLSRQHMFLAKDLDLQVKDLIANNPEVAGGSSYKDRQARAHMLLASELETVKSAEISLKDLEILIDVLKTKRSELKNLQQRLKDQFRICQEEIGLGGRWRDPRTSGLELTPGYGVQREVEPFNLLETAVSKAVAEVNETPPAPMSVASLIEEEGTGFGSSEVDNLLDALEDEDEQPKEGDLDIDSLLDGDFDLEV